MGATYPHRVMLRTRALRPSLSRTAVASVVALAVLGTVAACGGSDGGTPAAEPSVQQSITTTPTPTPEPTSPFTGLPGIGNAVMAVKMDNTNTALPHLGLTSADIVYVEQVEGGLTRLAVIFASKRPEVIAPIRSARETDAELLPTFGKIPVAFSGGVASVHAMIAAAGLKDISEDKGGAGYYRIGGRYAPYNLAGDPDVLIKRAKPVAPKNVGLVFGSAPAGGKSATKVVARFPSASIGFDYKKATNRWVYKLNGSTDQVPGRAAASASTVIIQYVTIGTAGRGDKVGNSVPFTRSVGTGKALILRDGKAYKATWSRPSAEAPTKWTYKGADFPMAAGQPWIVLAPKGSAASVS